MGSRLRETPKQIFELFTEVARPNKIGDDAFVLQKFPEDYDDQEVIKSIPRFAFPCESESSAVDHFTFVLTDIDSKFKFGFCRHATGSQTCLCVISCFPWYEIFYKLLNYAAEILNRSDADNVVPLLEALYKQEILGPGTLVEVVTPSLTDKFSFDMPVPNQLAGIPESRNLTEYYNAVDTINMMSLFASMLNERRIIITSKKLSRLTACVHASTALLYPMHWQHLYIPVLPSHLLDYLSAPMPYVIGVHASLMDAAHKKQEFGDAIILNADNNSITSPYSDLEGLPQHEVSNLKKSLRAQQSERMQSNLLGDGVSRAFLKAMVALIGGYRDALKFRPGEQITFDPDAFVQSRPSNMHAFLEQMLQLQIFEQFINERLDMLNSGQGFQDEFEMEANLWADKWGTKSRYSQWLNDMKRQGKKIKTSGKDRWAEFTNKFRDKSKKAVKDIKSKFDKEEDDKPTAIPTTSLQPQRPPRPPPPPLSKTTSLGISSFPTQKQSIIRRTSYKEARQYKVLDLEDLSPDGTKSPPRVSRRISADDSDVGNMNMKRVSVDLMGDPDIQNVFKKSYSLEDISAIDEAAEVLVEEEIEQGEDALVALDNVFAKDTNANSSGLLPRLTQPHRLPPGGVATATTNGTPWAIKPKYSLGQNFKEEQRERPVPAPRPSREPDQLLIKLESPESDQETASQNQGDTGKKQKTKTLDDIEFDPLKLPSTSPSQQQTNSVQTPQKHVQSNAPVTEQKKFNETPSPAAPVPKPRINRNSLSRKDAFHREKRPESFVRKPAGQQPISEARTAFMQSQPTKPTLRLTESTLDQFDPLMTGQLAVDTPKLTRSVSRDSPTQKVHQEENLLKEWNMDFSKVKAAAGPPAVPPKPPPHQRHSVYIANPSQLTQLYGGQMGYSPSSPNKYATLSTSTPSVHLQYSQQHLPRTAHDYPAPVSPHFVNAQQGAPPPKSPYVQSTPSPARQTMTLNRHTPQRPGSQDPFTDVLSMTSNKPAVSSTVTPSVTSSVTSNVTPFAPTPPARSQRNRAGWEQFE